VWLTDPVDGPGLDERVRELGEPAGVVQLLDRHSRDCAAIAARLGVRLHVVEAPDGIEARQIVYTRFWKEIALWLPEERVLVCADALGSLGYFRARNEPFGVHPLLRLFPPKQAYCHSWLSLGSAKNVLSGVSVAVAVWGMNLSPSSP
jgi:hypothetical protein